MTIDNAKVKDSRLTVLNPRINDKGPSIALCICSCGTRKEIPMKAVKSGNVRSCGCWAAENRKSNAEKNFRKNEPKISSAKHIYASTYADDDLDFETFLELSQLPCYYCGSLPHNVYNRFMNRSGGFRGSKSQVSLDWANQADFVYNGLDRVDNTKAHTKTNVVPCCRQCNQAKSAFTQSEFYSWVERVFRYSVSKRSVGG
jgi:hypothetical protein